MKMFRCNVASRNRSSLRLLAILSCFVYRSFGFPFHTNTNQNTFHHFLLKPCQESYQRQPKSAICFRIPSKTLPRYSSVAAPRGPGLSSSLEASPDEGLPKMSIYQAIKKRKKWFLSMFACLLIPVLGGWGSSTKIFNFVLKTVGWKNYARIIGLFSAMTAIYSNVKTRRRQSIDATSEWQRYAQRPGARGRAIMVLMIKQMFLIGVARSIIALGKKSEGFPALLRQHAGRKFSQGLLKLGPLYIKLGQIVSCRPGLIGEEWVDALSDLQDKVPARTGQNAMDLVYAALNGGEKEFDRIFQEFDSTPLAAASLGQVHYAKLRENGCEVALKVQRPHLKQIYDQDFALLTTIAKWMDKFSKSGRNVGGVESSWTRIFSDAESILYREIDYRDEAENAVRFANDFGLGIGGVGNVTTTSFARNDEPMPNAAEWLRTPYIYTHLSNERLLVQEYVPSFKITDQEQLDGANITQGDRTKLADDLARAYLRQFCSNLFFSTDPHPGNIGVEMVPKILKQGPFGESRNQDIALSPNMVPRLVMYDFGQASTLTQNQADGILEIIEAIIDTDVDRSINAFQKMGVLVDDADLDQVRNKIADNYRTGKIKANRKTLRQKGFQFRDEDDMKIVNGSEDGLAVSTDIADTSTNRNEQKYDDNEVMSYFTLPAEYAFVARAISQMDGVGKSLDPEFDFISNAAPYIVEVKGTDLYLKDEASKFISSSQDRMRACLLWMEKEIKGLLTN